MNVQLQNRALAGRRAKIQHRQAHGYSEIAIEIYKGREQVADLYITLGGNGEVHLFCSADGNPSDHKLSIWPERPLERSVEK